MENPGFLHQYFLNNGHRRLHKWTHYFDVYERHFSRFRNKSPTVVEIGVHGGGSIAMWKEYFGPGSRIVGVDINPACKAHEAEDIEVFIGSQDDPALMDKILEKYPNIDIFIDDGSHRMNHIRKTFELMYHRISKTGVYLAEDLHTCYWENFGGGLHNPNSFMEFTKAKIDELNAVHTKGAVAITEFTAMTHSISFYDSIIAFEKRPQAARVSMITGPLTISKPAPSAEAATTATPAS